MTFHHRTLQKLPFCLSVVWLIDYSSDIINVLSLAIMD